MKLQNYFQDPQTLHVGTEPLRAYYIPCGSTEETKDADMLTTSRAINLNGNDWKFKFYESYHDVPEECIKKDACTKGYDTIPVPSCWQILGYESNNYLNVWYPIPFDPPYVPDENPAGVYVKEFELTAEEASQKIFLNFDGVDSCYYVWVNGEFVGYSQISHSGSEFDITEKVQEGKNRLTVIVLRWCDGTYLEDQDKLRFSGIFRDVYLLVRPKERIRDYFVHTNVKDTFDRADIDVELELVGNPAIEAKLYSPEGILIVETTASEGKIHLEVEQPDLWNAEHPALYTLMLITDEEVIAQKVGIRRIDIRGNVIYFNGVKFKIKGTNRHDSSPYTGATISREQLLTDLKLMKEHNINAIRTSHYPNSPWATQMYDKYGFYVMDEADVEAHGAAAIYGGEGTGTEMDEYMAHNSYGWMVTDPSYEKAVVDRIQHLVHRDKNCASVFSWSMGNESGYGPNMEKAAAWIKSYDPDRVLNYENAYWDQLNSDRVSDRSNLDVYSRMYASVEFVDWFCSQPDKKPMIQVEYCHAMGNGPGDLEDYFERLYKYDGYIGGFVWEWCDHSVYMGKTPEGKDKFFYGGDWVEEVSDGNFCMDGLVYPDRRPHTGLKEHKNVARPIRAKLLDAENGLVELDNKQDFTNIRDSYRIRYEVVTDGKVVSKGILEDIDCPAKAKVQVNIPEKINAVGNTFLHLHYVQKEEALLTPAGHEAGHDQLTVCRSAETARLAVAESLDWKTEKAASGEILVSESEREIVLMGSQFRYVFQKQKGTFSSLVRNQNQLIEKPIELNIWRAPMDNDRNIREQWEHAGYDRARIKVYGTKWESMEEEIFIISEFSLAAVSRQPVVKGTILWAVDKDGKVAVSIDAKRVLLWPPMANKALEPMPFLPRFGLRLFLPKAYQDVTYFGYGPAESYQDKHRNSYVDLFETSVKELHEDYLMPQENGSHWNCTGLGLSTCDGRKVLITGSDFSFNVSNYTQEELTAKGHNFELQEAPYTVLCLDGYMSGCGSNSCGPELLEKYRVNEDELSMKFVLEIQ